MLKNYLKIAVRNLLRYKAFSFINVFGLAIGIACVVLILLFVSDELSYDRFHTKADRIYRIITHYNQDGNSNTIAMGEHKLGPLLQTDFPEIKEIVRMSQVNPIVRVGDQVFQENRFYIADANFFKVFSFDLISGNRETVLTEPYTVVLNEDMAKKYFGDENPVGKVIHVLDTVPMKITGLMRNLPGNSHFHADFVCSMKSEKAFFNNLVFNNWGEISVYNYLLLPEGLAPASLESRFKAFIAKNQGAESAEVVSYHLQPLTDIHLQDWGYEHETNGSMSNIYVFLSIALAILIIAAINYMNLATARSASRAKEVGVRKVIGADRAHLIRQFLTESVLITGLALVMALGLVKLFLPVLNSLANKSLTANYLIQWEILLGSVAFALLLGIGAGSYPAFFLSGFQPIQVLKGKFTAGVSGAWLRKGFVVVQFCISIGLIAGVITIYKQLQYMKSKELGFSAEQIVTFGLPNQVQPQYEAFKNELKNVPNVKEVSISSKQLLGRLSSNLGFKAEGVDPEKIKSGIQVVVVDHDFFRTIGAQMIEGREFSKQFPTDAESGFILNQAAVEMLGWQSAVGKSFETSTVSPNFEWIPKKGQVVGVVKDFHYEPLFSKIVPVVFYIDPNWGGNVTIRLSGQDIPATVAGIRSVWNKFATDKPFEPSFLDERLQRLYFAQEQFGQLIGYFSILAIFIACLGLYGLATFTAEQRTKEIGIRKVLGASVTNVVGLLSKDFLKLVLLANVIAWPLAWWAMRQWLQDFAYRTEVSPWVFVLAGGSALVIALLTVSYRAIRAGLANPVKSLRTE
jgi:putative ABC transport system permease protein